MKMQISRDKVCLGAWLESEVRTLYNEGLLFPTDYCWREGMNQWQRLDSYLRPLPSKPSIFAQRTGSLIPRQS